MEFLRANLWEVKKSTTLRLFGLILSLGHVLVFLSWAWEGNLPIALMSSKAQMCWPILEDCEFTRVLSVPLLRFVYGCYFGFAILTGLLMLSTRIVGAAWFSMLLTTFMMMLLYFQDYRLSSNVIYLQLLCSFIWLFIPNKTPTLKAIALSYFFAKGLIMLSPEWLIGKWYLEHADLPKKFAEWLAAISTMVVFICPVALFFKDLRYFLVSFLTLQAYLISSLFIGNFIEPGILALVTLLFALDLYEQRKLEREFIYQSFIRPEPSKIWPWVVVSLFWFAQVVPRAPIQWPSYVNHFGTLYSLNPIPPHRECVQYGFFIYDSGIKEIPANLMSTQLNESQCDPYLHFLRLKELCSEKKSEPGFKTIESFFYARGLKDPAYKAEFEAADLCKPNTSFKDLKAML
ncbi:MAG: hypothetical protein HRT45_10415 [Bdellovibrionales bacterium]|nr:hypothetical protein [Bdellovibrionales bacterium]